jgi:transcriptional regulator of acetoin/glycerol metabolism
MSLSGTELPKASSRVRAKNHFRDVVIGDKALGSQLSKVSSVLHENPVIHIRGDVGTGKSLTARMLHAASEREGEFVNIDCSMLTENTVNDVFFGSNEASSSILARAKFGTLHLDNVDSLPKAIQPAIKHLITHQEVMNPVTFQGDATDILLLSSTSVKLKKSEFVNGLHLLLTGQEISLPRTRDRSDLREIILKIVTYKSPNLKFDDKALDLLLGYDWPENFHEVRSIIDLLVRKCEKIITETDILSTGLQFNDTQQSKVVCEACSGTSWKEELCKAIKNVLAENNGNVSEAARQLGMSRTTIYKHLS